MSLVFSVSASLSSELHAAPHCRRGGQHFVVAVPSPRRHLGMADAGGPSETSGGHGPNDLPVMPGPEKPLLHLAIEFVEMLERGVAKTVTAS